MKNNNVVLIGFMGCGKTSIGKNLANTLELNFIDVDQYIENKMDRTIPEIFSKKGEQYFREVEKKAIETISEESGYIIATGGGAILNFENINNLKKNGTIIYLKAEIDHIYNNIKGDDNRPLLQTDNPYDTIKVLLTERENMYEKAADIIIDVTNRTIVDIVNCISNNLKEEL